jgi:peptidoglycan/xylan/chitin deacetylase (PgdA/CDA1 family)
MRSLVGICLGAVLVASVVPAAAQAPVGRTVVITIDDLPLATPGAYRDDAHRVATIKALCKVLSDRKIPAVGFFNLHRRAPKLIAAWKKCDLEWGNHTLTHLHADKVPLARYLKDLEKGHAAVRKHVGPDAVISFRYPFLRRGFTPKTHAAIKAKLVELGSPVVPVTIDTLDWWYAKQWLEARADGDKAKAERLRQAWRWNLEESTIVAEHLSRDLFGREPPQILLLHANEINARHLGEYLDWLSARGYRFVTRAQAMKDPAYAEEVTTLSPTGDSQWLRLRRNPR